MHVFEVSTLFKAAKQQFNDDKWKYYTHPVMVCGMPGVFGRTLAGNIVWKFCCCFCCFDFFTCKDQKPQIDLKISKSGRVHARTHTHTHTHTHTKKERKKEKNKKTTTEDWKTKKASKKSRNWRSTSRCVTDTKGRYCVKDTLAVPKSGTGSLGESNKTKPKQTKKA